MEKARHKLERRIVDESWGRKAPEQESSQEPADEQTESPGDPDGGYREPLVQEKSMSDRMRAAARIKRGLA